MTPKSSSLNKKIASGKAKKSKKEYFVARYPILISTKNLEKRIKEISKNINTKFSGKTPVMICLLKGAFIFFSEIAKNLTIDCEMDFMSISSYIGTQSKEIKYIEKDFSRLENKEIIIIDDILDTGKTLHFVINYLTQFKPKKIHLITLLKRKGQNIFNIKPLDFGFEINNEFVVGYGLDYEEKLRNLPYISYL